MCRYLRNTFCASHVFPVLCRAVTMVAKEALPDMSPPPPPQAWEQGTVPKLQRMKERDGSSVGLLPADTFVFLRPTD